MLLQLSGSNSVLDRNKVARVLFIVRNKCRSACYWTPSGFFIANFLNNYRLYSRFDQLLPAWTNCKENIYKLVIKDEKREKKIN